MVISISLSKRRRNAASNESGRFVAPAGHVPICSGLKTFQKQKYASTWVSVLAVVDEYLCWPSELSDGLHTVTREPYDD